MCTHPLSLRSSDSTYKNIVLIMHAHSTMENFYTENHKQNYSCNQ